MPPLKLWWGYKGLRQVWVCCTGHFWVPQLGGDTTVNSWLKANDGAKKPAMHRTAPTTTKKTYPTPHVNKTRTLRKPGQVYIGDLPDVTWTISYNSLFLLLYCMDKICQIFYAKVLNTNNTRIFILPLIQEWKVTLNYMGIESFCDFFWFFPTLNKF